MTADKARLTKPNLSYIVIAKPVRPFAEIDIDTVKPKIDSPFDITTVKKYITANVSEVWIFNRETVEIYQKLVSTPVTTGKLTIKSDILRDEVMLLLKSLVDILQETGLQPIDTSNNGSRYDLLYTFLKGSKSNSKKYKLFIEASKVAISKHIVRAVAVDYLGKGTVENLPFETYYVFGGWYDYSSSYIWDMG